MASKTLLPKGGEGEGKGVFGALSCDQSLGRPIVYRIASRGTFHFSCGWVVSGQNSLVLTPASEFAAPEFFAMTTRVVLLRLLLWSLSLVSATDVVAVLLQGGDLG